MVVVVLVLAGVAVLGAVVVLAMGRGGELTDTHPDYAPLRVDDEGRPVLGPDGDRPRFPRSIWGYQMQVTDDAVQRLVTLLHERDARVADLERQLHDLRGRGGEQPSIGALHGLEEPGDGNGVPLRKETVPVEDEREEDR